MSSHRQDVEVWPASLADRAAPGADAAQIADAVLDLWAQVDGALNPIIGHRGFSALYHRSLKLCVGRHPWLAASTPSPMAPADTALLHTALLQQDAAEAAAGASTLFQTFRDLLASLVGAGLTDQILQPVWAPPSAADPAQDTPP
jgi:hypothetical protein